MTVARPGTLCPGVLSTVSCKAISHFKVAHIQYEAHLGLAARSDYSTEELNPNHPR